MSEEQATIVVDPPPPEGLSDLAAVAAVVSGAVCAALDGIEWDRELGWPLTSVEAAAITAARADAIRAYMRQVDQLTEADMPGPPSAQAEGPAEVARRRARVRAAMRARA